MQWKVQNPFQHRRFRVAAQFQLFQRAIRHFGGLIQVILACFPTSA
jgi:hypothetical protein